MTKVCLFAGCNKFFAQKLNSLRFEYTEVHLSIVKKGFVMETMLGIISHGLILKRLLINVIYAYPQL